MKPITIQNRSGADSQTTLHKMLIYCGILSSLLYVGMNIVGAMLYEGYSSVTQTVSELSAIDAPTRHLWVSMAFAYSLLVIAFGYGVLQSQIKSRKVHVVGLLLIANGILGFFWPPMHQRQVIADGGGTLTDTMHIAFTFITVPLMILQMIYGAFAFGKKFQLYSFASVVILIVFGVLTGMESPHISSNLPTPYIGIWERVNIGVYMLWIAVFAIVLLRAERKSQGLQEITWNRFH